MNEIRVLSVMTRLLRGGSERRLFDVVAAVPARHTVVIGPESDPGQIAALEADCEVVVCPALVRQVAPARDLAALTFLARLARRDRFDVVHTHQAKAGLLGRVAAGAARTPVVYHSASMASFGPGYGRVESTVFAVSERVSAPLVDAFFVVGDDLAGRLAANGVARHRLQVVRSSLELDPFRPVGPGDRDAARARFGVAPDAAAIGYVGSLEARKGVDQLIGLAEAAADASGRPVALLIAGAGPERGALEAQAAAAGADVQVQLLGHIPDVPELMRAVDVVVLPSSAEGLPQVLVQAAHVGVPFVAFDVDGVHELLDLGAAGTAVPLGDLPAFRAAVIRSLVVPPPPGTIDPGVWAQWRPVAVRQAYRDRYESDLGRSLDA